MSKEEPVGRGDFPPGFARGLEEFNRRDFYRCHDTLEAVWKAQADERKDFTQGIIQVAVAYYHHERGNDRGALKLLTRAIKRLEKYRPGIYGIDVNALVATIESNIRQLEAGSPKPALTITSIEYEPN